ncbi:MAG TPA: thiol:disulfide interchange protein DsbA/DsbL, partial [Gallionella sp.]
VVAVLLLAGGTVHAEVELGRDYNVLPSPQPVGGKKIEVLEFFFYGCGHCFNLHTSLVEWEKKMPKDAELTYVPTIFRDNMEQMARTFYALESMGKLKQLHDPLYRAWNIDGVKLFDEKQIADFVSSKGVDREKFLAAYNSFSMQSRVTRAKQMTRSYMISGTPTLIVDGKYVITGLQPDDTISALDEVIALARKSRASGK